MFYLQGRGGTRKSIDCTQACLLISVAILYFQDLIPGVQVHSTPALEAVMDFGNEDQDDGDEREAGEVVDDDDDEVNKENKENKDSDEQDTEKIEPEPKKRKERIVKVEEGRRKIKINRQSLEQEENKMEVEGGMYKVLYVPLKTLSAFIKRSKKGSDPKSDLQY